MFSVDDQYLPPQGQFMGRYLREQEEERVRAQERARADRRVKTVEEKRKSDRAKAKAVAKEAHEAHTEKLSVALAETRIAISREAAAKVQLEKARAENEELLLLIKRIEKLNKTVVDALAACIREDGLTTDRACKKIGLKFSQFEYWYAQGAADTSDPIYIYLRQQVDEAIADDEAKWRKKLEKVSEDVFEDIVSKEGDVIGQRLARRASDKAITFALERRHPAYAPKTMETLPTEKSVETDLTRLSTEAFAEYRHAEETLDRLKKAAEALKQQSLVSSSNKVIDVYGESVDTSSDDPDA
jgi:hypothetical protein